MTPFEWELKYPALMYGSDMQLLATLVSHLPANSKIVEIGSRVGGSAKIILDHAPKSASLYCIDAEWQYTKDDDSSMYLYMPNILKRFPEILNYNRYKSSSLGYAQKFVPNPEVQRNIIA